MSVERRNYKQEYFKGCLVGGGIGDALGYAVEFISYRAIISKYGAGGIRAYDLSHGGKALISDDTQMTLFTANGILNCDTVGRLRGERLSPIQFIHAAYKDWLYTQGCAAGAKKEGVTWLVDVPDLNHPRAPGNTCLSALFSDKERSVANPINTSKGCGSIMRIAPVGLVYGLIDRHLLLNVAMEVGAITHGNPMSHLTCALGADIIARIIYDTDRATGKPYDSIKNAACDALYDLDEYLKSVGDASLNAPKKEFFALMKKALELTENGAPDVDNIGKLGEGWIAEEALAIALYCACKYQSAPIEGIIAAVNHDGDSDSTGAITGNILGAFCGYNAFPREFVDDLELADVIEEIAVDLATGCSAPVDGEIKDERWRNKYAVAGGK